MGKCSNKDNFIELFHDSCGISDLARKLGYKLKGSRVPGGVSQIINRYIDKYQLDKSNFRGQNWSKGKTRESDPIIEKQAIKLELPWNEAFAFGSQVHNQRLLKRLVRAGKKKYQCERCKLYEWLNENIVLELHHINGIHHDNREENLQILCPNCHSQIERQNEKMKRENKKYTKRRDKLNSEQRDKLNAEFVKRYRPVRKCSSCSSPIGKGATTGKCVKCSHKARRKTERPTREVLKNMIENQSWTSIGKKFGLSDNAVRKWARNYGLL